MSFLAPLFLLGGLAIAVPIVLHLLRRDVAPEVPFTAVHLLRRAPVERSRQRRLRDLLLLAARIAALLLLAAAFARPYVAGAGLSPLVIVAVDRSFSMGAPGVFEQARARALEALPAAAGRAAVIAFDDRPEVVAPPGAVADARRAIEALAPTAGATRYGRLIARAAELAGGTPARLVVVTDLQRAGWEDADQAAVPETLTVEVVAVDGPRANVSVAGLRLDAGRAVVAVRNAGPSPWRGRVTVSGGREAGADVEVAADSTAEVTIGAGFAGTGSVTAAIEDPEGYPADNRRVADLRPAPAVRILVFAEEGGGREPAFYVTRAIAAGASDLEAEVRQAEGAEPPVLDVSRTAAVAVLATRGMTRDTRMALGEFVTAGGGLLIAAGPDVDPAVVAAVPGLESLQRAKVADHAAALAVTDLRHPIFRPFGVMAANLGQVRFDRAWAVAPDGWTVAAAFTDGTPALLERTVGAGRILLFTSDLDRRWNDFPLHPGFVPFVLEALRFAAGGQFPERSVTVGDTPAGLDPKPGVYDTSDGRRVVVNVDPGEASVTRLGAGDFAAMIETVPVDPGQATAREARQTEAAQGYWQYGLLLMLAALVAESVVGRV